MSTTSSLSHSEIRHLVVEELELLSAAEFETSQALAARLHLPLEHAIAERGRVPLRFILEQLAASWGVGYTDLKIADIDPASLLRIRESVARDHMAVAFALGPDGLCVAMENPRDEKALAALRRAAARPIVPVLAEPQAIRKAHLLYREDLRTLLRQCEMSPAMDSGADIDATTLLSHILEFSALSGASDIHIEPYVAELLVRFRIDGVLRDVLSRPAAVALTLATRIKALAGMRLDDRRSPQDGRFEHDAAGTRLDLRVSVLPTQFGEKVVMRVIQRTHSMFDLDSLGLLEDDYTTVARNIAKPYGMILVTGPTGCGKSTTLYAMLTRLGTERRNLVNISTIEEPVEHTLIRAAQVSVNVAAGIDFASGLRALLRQDPDVIMVGEIRDRETADVAVRAALVGRLLLSTLHTNSATAAIPRLLDMGIEPFLVSSALNLVIAQRLVRRICTSCRETVGTDGHGMTALRARPDYEHILSSLRTRGLLAGAASLESVRLCRGRGCERCGGTGFRGRVGIFEILEVNDALRTLILSKPDTAAVLAAARTDGAHTMLEDGLAKAVLGETTITELLRVAS